MATYVDIIHRTRMCCAAGEEVAAPQKPAVRVQRAMRMKDTDAVSGPCGVPVNPASSTSTKQFKTGGRNKPSMSKVSR